MNEFIGVFDLNNFDKFNFQRFSKKSKRKIYLMFNPYKAITECGKTSMDLKVGDKIKSKDGVILKVIGSGGAGLFGKDSFSWDWVLFHMEGAKLK